MEQEMSSSKVISIKTRISDRNHTSSQKNVRDEKPNMRVIAITSGKGGVGKTNIVANLGYALSRLGKRVLVLDADLGLGNLDILLGLAPKYNLSHVLMGGKSIAEITVEGPGNIKILPASSGIQELTELSNEQKIQILNKLNLLSDPVDILLIDTAAGISSNVMYFNTTAQEIMVVVSPEPTSITDAYALMKVLSVKYLEKHFKLLVNLASSVDEAEDVFRQLSLVADRFLDISIEYIGHIFSDENITKCVRIQKVISQIYPDSQASKCFISLAEKICQSVPPTFPKGDSNFFWKNLLQKKFE